MKKMNRLISFCAAAAMLCNGTALSIPASAVSGEVSAASTVGTESVNVKIATPGGSCGEKDNTVFWTFTNGVLYINGEGRMKDFTSNIKVPWASVQSQIKKIEVDDGVTYIGNNAFRNMENLGIAELADSVTEIGSYAFENCKNLISIQFPANVKVIGLDALKNTAWLTEQREKSKLVIVNHLLVDGATAAGDVIIPDGVTAIAERAFCNSEITTVVLPESLETIHTEAFAMCGTLKELYIPAGVKEIGDAPGFLCSKLAKISVDSANKNYRAVDDVLYTKDMKTLIQYPIGKKQTSFSVPEGVETLGAYSLEDANFQKFTLPDSLRRIERNACYSLGAVGSLVIPEYLEELAPNAIADCSTMDEITILNPNCKIGSGNFMRFASPYPVVYGYKGKGYTAEPHVEDSNKSMQFLEFVPLNRYGDVNLDGKVNSEDGQLVDAYCAEDPEAIISSFGKRNADVNQSGSPDMGDGSLISQYGAEAGEDKETIKWPDDLPEYWTPSAIAEYTPADPVTTFEAQQIAVYPGQKNVKFS